MMVLWSSFACMFATGITKEIPTASESMHVRSAINSVSASGCTIVVNEQPKFIEVKPRESPSSRRCGQRFDPCPIHNRWHSASRYLVSHECTPAVRGLDAISPLHTCTPCQCKPHTWWTTTKHSTIPCNRTLAALQRLPDPVQCKCHLRTTGMLYLLTIERAI